MGYRTNMRGGLALLTIGLVCLVSPAARAQEPATRPVGDAIQLNLPDSVELRVLTDYIGQRLGVDFVYTDEVGTQKVTLKSSAKLPQDALLTLLQSALQVRGLVLLDTDQPRIKKIVATGNVAAGAQPATRPGELASAVTQVFSLIHIDAASADQIVKTALTQPGGNSIGIPQQKLLVVSDYAGNMQRIAALIKRLDEPRTDTAVQFVQLVNATAAQLAPQVAQILNARAGVAPQGTSPAVEVVADPRTNQLAVVGEKSRVGDIVEVIRQLDVSLALETKTYRFTAGSPERADRIMKQIIEQASSGRLYQSAVDKEAGLLVVVSTPEMHKRLESLKKDLDVAATKEESPIQFYKLSNATAADVLKTIRGIEGKEDTTASAAERFEQARKGRGNPARPNPIGQSGPGMSNAFATSRPSLATPLAASREEPADGRDNLSFQTEQARVTADPNTNTIIVWGPPSVQKLYEQLIRTLDKRRPQVMLECTLVSLDTTDDFSMGVDIAVKGGFGTSETLLFSSFGLSTLNAKTGRLSIIPGTGFNGALISTDIADAVVRALASNRRARVVSAPRILVNDNATGTLTSIAESPFTSINTAVGTISTTTFAGYAEAGTQITLTPHISEADYLQLEYTVSVNTFTGTGSNGIPPPRQTNAVQSTVTIPDGSTVVVGGLNRKNKITAIKAVPVLGQIPILEYFFSSREITDEQTTLFVFLRPVILRDDRFEDLKYLSRKDVGFAGIKADAPTSEPLVMP